MKIIRTLLAASAAIFYVCSASAQTSGTVSNHAIAVGKGAGQTGFTSVACADKLFLSGVSGLDPACRAIVGADLPFPAVSTLGGVKSLAAASNQFLTGLGTDGVLTRAQPAFSNISGTIASGQVSGSYTGITGLGTVTVGAWNGTAIPVANGGTGATTAANARTNLGVAIGSNVQAWDADLDALAALTGTNNIYYRSAANTWSPVTIGANLTFTGGTLAASGGGGGSFTGTITPQHRITLTSGVAVMTSSVTGATTVRVTPSSGNFIPIYDGTNMSPTAFAETSQATTDTTKSPAAVATNSNYDIFCWIDSGTNRCTRGPVWSSNTSRGTGAGTSELVRVNGLYLNANNVTNGPAAQRGTYMGTIHSNGSSAVDFIVGGSGSGGVAGSMGVWNMYNRTLAVMNTVDTGTQYTYSTSTNRQAGASTGNQNSFVVGLVEDAVDIYYLSRVDTPATATAFCVVGIGLDNTTFLTQRGFSQTVAAVVSIQTPSLLASIYPPLGFHSAIALENGGSSAGCKFNGDSNNILSAKVWN